MTAPSLQPSTTTLERTETTPELDDGDHERMAHIVLEGFRSDENEEGFVSAGPSVAEGIINGTPVRALCGKTWVPNRDPKRYPLCPTCKEIAAHLGWELPAG